MAFLPEADLLCIREVAMKKILVSSCLFGDCVRYDAALTECTDPRFLRWKEEGRLIKLCPEVFGGLTVPRPDSQRVADRVMTRTGEDVTEAYEIGAAEAVRLASENDIIFAVMKQRSPSCGSSIIYDGSFTGIKIPGEGVAVQRLREAGFQVFGEDELDAAERILGQTK